MSAQWEIFRQAGLLRRYRFRLRAANGRVVLQSQGYKSKRSALDGCKAVLAAAQEAEFQDLTDGQD